MILVDENGQPRCDDLGVLDFDDDAHWDANRGIELIAAAAVAQVAEVYDLMARNAFGVRRAAIDAAGFLTFFGICDCTADDIEAACRAEIAAQRLR